MQSIRIACILVNEAVERPNDVVDHIADGVKNILWHLAPCGGDKTHRVHQYRRRVRCRQELRFGNDRKHRGNISEACV